MSFFELSGLRRIIGCPDLAIDLGTANTRVFASGYGIIADEPSIVSLAPETGMIAAVGREAARLSTFGDGFVPHYPLNSGVVSDLEAATLLLRHIIERVRWHGLVRPRAIACIPTDACERERESLIEATRQAGVAAVVLVPEPLAAAIGAGLDVSSTYARMLVDIGDGVTDIAVIRSGELVTTAAVRTACSDLHAAIVKMVSDIYGVSLFPSEAQRLTHRVGSLDDSSAEQWIFAQGLDLHAGTPVRLRVSSCDLLAAIEPVLAVIIEAIDQTVRELPAETSCEVIESGICLTGGGANLRGISRRLSLATSLDVSPASDPMRAVINGAQQMLRVGVETNIWQ
jgi:rod shape-determining protein MreB